MSPQFVHSQIIHYTMPNSDLRRGFALTVAVLTMASYVVAAPLRRDAPALTAQTIRDFTTGAIGQFLASHNADQQAFNVKGSWSTIDFSGDSSSLLTPGQINNAIFTSCDTQNDRSTNQISSFSGTYKDFVQDVRNCQLHLVYMSHVLSSCR
jgi:hypothetical protein